MVDSFSVVMWVVGTYEGWVREVPSLLLIPPSGAGKMAQQVKALSDLA